MANLTNNNKLIDEINSKLKQVNVMPTADVSSVGKIIQYIGPDDDVNNFFNGHFYRCISDGQDPATYTWEEIVLGVTSYDELTDKLIAGENITIEDKCTISGTVTGPCDNGFHIPTKAEWDSVILNLTSEQIVSALHIPYGGIRRHNDGSFDYVRSEARLWVSNAITGSEDMMNDYYAYISQYATAVVSSNTIALGCNIRAFKNAPVVPDDTWTETVEGKVREKDGLISILVDTDTYVTMQNKNVGATTVWNTGDTVSSENIGDYFQWGNNHGFKLNSTGDTSSTQVDASSYGPGEYDSDTFVIGQINWMSVDNYDLWGAETGCAIEHNVISATVSNDYNELINKPLSIEQVGYYGYGSQDMPMILYSYPNEIPNTGDHLYAQIEEGGEIIDYTEAAKQEMGAEIYFKNDNGVIGAVVEMDGQIVEEVSLERYSESDTVGSDVVVADDYKKPFNLSYLYDTNILLPENGQVLTMKNGKWTNKEIPVPNMSYNDLNDKLIGGNNINISRQVNDYSAIQGPCEDGFHIPTLTEFQTLKTILNFYNLGAESVNLHKGGFVDPTYASESWITNQSLAGVYWTSTAFINGGIATTHTCDENFNITDSTHLSFGYFIRAFKDEPVIPDNTWTEIVAGKVWHNETEGLYTVKSYNDAEGYITLQDKNVGATEMFDLNNPVYSEETCGYFFQRGNMYGFPYEDGSSYCVEGQQDTSNYSWRNPYNDERFFTGGDDWSLSPNPELWGGKTQVTHPYIVDNTLKYNAGENVTISDGEMYSAQKGPCDGGYHIPSYTELEAVRDVLANDIERITYYHLPLGGFINSIGVPYRIGEFGAVHAAEYDPGRYDRSYDWTYYNSTTTSGAVDGGNYGGLNNIRAFKNTPVIPDNTWTETVTGKVWYNASKGLITVYAQNQYYTMQDKNVGATVVYNYGDTVTMDNSGYYYQWGNNQGFYYQSYEDAGSAKVDASEYGPTNPYYGDFIKGASWFLLTGNYKDLWGGVTRKLNNVISVNIPESEYALVDLKDTNIINPTDGQITKYDGTSGKWINSDLKIPEYKTCEGGNITIIDEIEDDYSAIQGPCGDGFHVPSTTEIQDLITVINGLNVGSGDNIKTYLHIPPAGHRSYSSGSILNQGTWCFFWTRTPQEGGGSNACRFAASRTSTTGEIGTKERATGYPIRAFKNEYVEPDSTWTASVGTLGSAGIFYNATLGLISLTNGSDKNITIKDKNEGATVVYDNGDTLTEENMGKFFQRGNNYGFPSLGTITTSSTRVNTSSYAPSTYSSDSFIASPNSPYDWSSPQNTNLWGHVTGIVPKTTGNKIVCSTDAGVKDSDIAFATITLSGRSVTFTNSFITTNTLVSYTILNGASPAGIVSASVSNGFVTFESTASENLQFYVKFEKNNNNSTILVDNG